MKRLLYILVIAALFQACKAGKNYKGTEFVQPTSYRQADTLKTVAYDSINTDSLEIDYADIRWWEMFNDPVLDTLVKEAFANNLNAMIAAETVLQSRYALKVQNAEMLPPPCNLFFALRLPVYRLSFPPRYLRRSLAFILPL